VRKWPPAVLSLLVAPLAALLGDLLFWATGYGLQSLGLHPETMLVELSLGIVAAFGVQVAADGYIYEQKPAWRSAIVGYLLAWPLAFGLGAYLFLRTYDLYTQGLPGVQLTGQMTYAAFYLTLSLGGWVAILRTRSVAVAGSKNLR
jgi:hypothetical protein